MRRRLGLIAAVAVVLLAQPLASVQAAPSSDKVLGWVARAACADPTPGYAACNAVTLVQERVSLALAKLLPRRAAGDVLAGPAGGYRPSTLASAYHVDPNAAAGGQFVVAIVDACVDPQIAHDLNTFDAQYQYPLETANTFRELAVSGSGTCSTSEAQGWGVETSLDVEAVRGICHRCKILLTEASSSLLSDLERAEDSAAAYQWIDGVTHKRLPIAAISNSFGAPENTGAPAGFASHFNHPGIAVIASNGDDGWYGWDLANLAGGHSDNATTVPAALNTVVAVGGTSLRVNADGTRASEQVWNANGPADDIGGPRNAALGATGGGCSATYTARGWQNAVAGYAALGCAAGKRSATDIAADADPFTGMDIFDSYGTGLGQHWLTVGGTSLAAPLIAGMWALSGGPAGVSYPALLLYGHFRAAPQSLFDVAAGSNSFCGPTTLAACSAAVGGNPNSLGGGVIECGYSWAGHTITGWYQCRARTGYDGPSGLGTPTGPLVFHLMLPTAVLSIPSVVRHRTAVTFSGAHSTDPFPGGKLVSYHWIFGDGSTGTTTTASVAHVYVNTGKYTLQLIVTDNYGLKSAARAASVTVT